MAEVSSNLAEIAHMLDGLGDLFNLSQPRRGRRLGDLAADVIAAGIQARTLEQQVGANGEPLAQNRGLYGRRKKARGIRIGVGLYGNDEVGGEMLEFEQIRGQVTIAPDEMNMTAGLDADVKEKMTFFTEGNPATGQPPRPFFELDADIEASLGELFDEAADQGIVDLGGA